ncbi:MAG: Fic family protein [Methanosarcinales archaeon]|nr:Fic family protein [Methanosarcinales archaeon]
MTDYIYSDKNWPEFTWDDSEIILILGKIRHDQGKLIGKMTALGFSTEEAAALEITALEIIKSFEIENERLNEQEVYSSIARHLGLNIPGLIPSGRNIDGTVEMIMDATQNYSERLTKERLFKWHTLLFSDSSYPVEIIGQWSPNQMYVIAGKNAGKERIRYIAPNPENTPAEMDIFLDWINNDEKTDPVIKAGVAHLWFLLIHPFEDGNGRLARAMTDMLLARSDGIPQRFYSMSVQIQKERKDYYENIQKAQIGTMDITEWLKWFLGCLERAVESSEIIVKKTIQKAEFWRKYSKTALNERQRKVVNILLEGFDGKLTSSKWAKITKVSQDTALRDITDLMEKGILRKENKGGRSTNYELAEF